MKRYAIAIGLLLLGIELLRRIGNLTTCYIELQYSAFLIDHSALSLLTECATRTIFWPFGLFL
jgi:hypothetical protein